MYLKDKKGENEEKVCKTRLQTKRGMDKKEGRGTKMALESAKIQVNGSQHLINRQGEILGDFQNLRLVQKVMNGKTD